MDAAIRSPCAFLLSSVTIVSHFWAKSSDATRAMPDEPPVIMATLFFSLWPLLQNIALTQFAFFRLGLKKCLVSDMYGDFLNFNAISGTQS